MVDALLDQSSVTSSIDASNLTKLNKKRYIAWLVYDMANTFYATGILTLMASTWILVTVQQKGFTYAAANGFFSLTLSVASIFMAIMLPILGALSDVTNERKRYVIFFSIISIISTAAFAITQNVIVLLIIFSISLMTYQWAQMFYDAMLPGVVPPGREAKLSAIAIAIGYIGGAFVIIYASFLNENGLNSPNANPEVGPLTLGYFPNLITLIVVGFFLLSVPLFFVRETNWQEISKRVQGDQIESKKNPNVWFVIKSSFGELKETFIDIYNNNRGMFYYIIAYFIIADIANLIVLINAQFLRDGLSVSEDVVLLTLVVFGIGIIAFSYFIGMICDKYGAKRGFQTVGVLWIIGLTILILTDFILPFGWLYVGVVILGPAFSGVWISQRQMVLELVPTDQEIGRYYGLTRFSGKISSALGPAIWGSLLFLFSINLDLSLSISFRLSILGMTLFLALGFLILHFFVPNKHAEFKERKQKLIDSLSNI